MNYIQRFQLHQIDPNPYQPRTSEDPEHIHSLARSIEKDGLLQIPVGRLIEDDSRVQLAFGHSRLAAFRLLDIEYEDRYGMMPVDLRTLTDQQMFEMSIAENVARKNLTPIEEAQAMLRYRDDFKKTSAEIGELFGMSDSAVRNKLRLLELPESAQESLKAGQIGEGSARRLLTLQRVRPDQVQEVIQKTAEHDLSPTEVEKEISYHLAGDKTVKTMWESWRKGTPLAGSGLWPLDWKPEKSGKTCIGCPAYVRISSMHYCCDKSCWAQKRNEWMNLELIRVRDELGITVYSPKEDGKIIVEHDWNTKNLFERWFPERDPHLRLKIKYTEYGPHKFTGSSCVTLISVDPVEVEKIRKEKEKRAESPEERNQRAANERRLRIQSDRFIRMASEHFAPHMGTPLDGPLIMLTKMAINRLIWSGEEPEIPEDPREIRNLYRTCVAEHLIRDKLAPWDLREQGPVAVAAVLKKTAEEWYVILPANWDALAQEYEAGGEAEE